MQTLLDASGVDRAWLVKLTAGLPGGIGNTGGECGGITAPLALIGLRHARDPLCRGIPVVVYKAQDLLDEFSACHGTTACREIRGEGRLPLRCIGVIRRAPEQCVGVLARDSSGVLSGEREDAYRSLHAYLTAREFHCAHAVLDDLRRTIPVTRDLADASSGFVAGTAFCGLTCSALTAGVMALGIAIGEVERSRLRVLRMIATMAVGGDAFADALNAFNRLMNLGHDLSRWFTGAFGSTQCRAITQCDFTTAQGVRKYIEADGVARCRPLARAVAAKVAGMIEDAAPGPDR